MHNRGLSKTHFWTLLIMVLVVLIIFVMMASGNLYPQRKVYAANSTITAPIAIGTKVAYNRSSNVVYALRGGLGLTIQADKHDATILKYYVVLVPSYLIGIGIFPGIIISKPVRPVEISIKE
jgi:hypothetical protein